MPRGNLNAGKIFQDLQDPGLNCPWHRYADLIGSSLQRLCLSTSTLTDRLEPVGVISHLVLSFASPSNLLPLHLRKLLTQAWNPAMPLERLVPVTSCVTGRLPRQACSAIQLVLLDGGEYSVRRTSIVPSSQ